MTTHLIDAPDGSDLGENAHIEVLFDRGGITYIDVSAKVALCIQTMELTGGELQIRIAPDWNRS